MDHHTTAACSATHDLPLLQITALSFAYRLPNGKRITALRNLNLQLQRGTILGLIGESGCGKTTMCNILMHSLSYHQGHIYLHGQELSTLHHTASSRRHADSPQRFAWWPWGGNSAQQQQQQTRPAATTASTPVDTATANVANAATTANTAANATAANGHVANTMAGITARAAGSACKNYYRLVQYVFQDPLSAMPPHLPLQHFACAPLLNLCHYSPKQARVVIEQLLEQVQLPVDTLQRYPQELSLGQLQRLNLIKSLSIKPDLLLCDEITSALDQQSAALCLQLLQEYQKDGGTVIFITHDLNLAPRICSHFALMFKGTIVEQWAQSEPPLHPYMQQLQQAQAIMAQEIDLSAWQEPTALSCPVSVDQLCPFLLRCTKSQERCLQQAPQLHQLNEQHQICCHLTF